jgi:hypothetical protein
MPSLGEVYGALRSCSEFGSGVFVLKKILITGVITFVLTAIYIYAIGYHGPRDFTSVSRTLPSPEEVVAHARELAGTPYDQLMGKWWNIGARTGFIVCSDVPNIAYGLSGFSLRRMLERDYAKNPSAYGTAPGDKPGDPFFHRRARNLYACLKGNGRLIPPGGTPNVGDLVFYTSTSHSYVSHVTLVTAVGEHGYSIIESAPWSVFAQETSGSAPIERALVLVGFGRILPVQAPGGAKPPGSILGGDNDRDLRDCVVTAARKQIGKTIHYDPSYQVLKYPDGDVPMERGVCTDVVIRALRVGLGWDLQKLVHDDMRRNFARYPSKWGLKGPDKNIDHRRVPNLATYFKRMGYSLKVTKNPADYKPGDFVTCIVPPNLPHIMIVSYPTRPNGKPLVIHNIGSGAREEDRLFEFDLTGHYRLRAKPGRTR